MSLIRVSEMRNITECKLERRRKYHRDKAFVKFLAKLNGEKQNE